MYDSWFKIPLYNEKAGRQATCSTILFAKHTMEQLLRYNCRGGDDFARHMGTRVDGLPYTLNYLISKAVTSGYCAECFYLNKIRLLVLLQNLVGT